MSHDYASHAGAKADFGTAFAAGAALNVAYVLVEAGFGFYSGSLALLADAAHNLTDVAGLLLAWGAVALGRRSPSDRHTYGFGRASILAALANGLALFAAVGALAWEAIQRFSAPTEIPGTIVMWVALLGIAINAGTAMLFMKGRKDDLNVDGALLHMAADAIVSAGVVLAALLIIVTGWQWLDPLAGLLVSGVIAWSSFGLLKSTIHLGLDGVPDTIDRPAVMSWLCQQPGVSSVHDLHIWAMSTTTTALTAHLMMPGGSPGDAFLDQIAESCLALGHASSNQRGAGPAIVSARSRRSARRDPGRSRARNRGGGTL